MRHIRWVGLVPSLLIVGILGGLIAPLSSEAVQPTITIQLDSGTAVSLLSPGSSPTCTAAEGITPPGVLPVGQGYTHCYSILIGTTFSGTNSSGSNRTYRVTEISTGSARLKLADTAGQDKFSLVGVQFVPVVADWLAGTDNSDAATKPNESEDHTITIVMNKTFDDGVNTSNGADYVMNVRSAGKFITGPTGGTTGTKKCNFSGDKTRVSDGKCDAISDTVQYSGVGTFSNIKSNVPIVSSTGIKNLTSPLSFTATGPRLSPHLSFDGATNVTLGQVTPDYPLFRCTNAADGTTIDNTVTLFDANHVPRPPLPPYNCRPTITLTMKTTLYGPDSLQVINGDDGFCVSCNEHITSKDAQKIKFVQDGVNLLTAIVHVKPKLKPLLQPIIDIGTVFLSSLTAPPDPSCPGKQVLGLITSGVNVADAVILSQDPDDAPGIPAVTGTIMVVKKIASNYDEMGAGESQFLIPQEDTTFDFTGEGLGIDQAFSIITNQCNGSCDAAGRQGSKTFAGLTTDGGLRTITEHPPVPNAPDPDGDDDAQWYTKNVTCTSSLGESGTIPNITQGTPGSISDRSGSFSVTNLKANEILICTFENGIFEIEFN